MHLKYVITALAAFSSLAAAAPAQDAKAADKGQGQNQNQNQNQNQDKNNAKGNNNNNNNNNKNNGDVNIIQNIIKPNIIVVQENLDKINQLQRQNERELAALVQSQLALATQLQTVKDNIRINHFKAQFPQANTIIVTVTGLVDNRNQGQQNKRYLVNQLLADNGQAGKQTLVMVTDPTNLEISTQQAASAQANAFGAARVQLESSASPAGSNTSDFSAQAVGSDAAPVDHSLSLAAFNQTAPFGQVGQTIILPAGTRAPQLLSVPDPAAIILPQQQGLFVQNAVTFLTDCATSAANAANGNPALAGAAAQIFSSFQQIAAAQLAGLSGLGIFNGNGANNTAQAPPPPPAQAQGQGQNLGSIAVGANQGGVQPPPAAAAQPPAQVATPPPPPAQAQGQQGGQNLGSIAVGANQGQPAPAAQPPAQVAAPPPASQNAPAAQPGAAIVDGANQAIAPVQFGKNPGTPPQAAPASAPPAAAPPQGNAGSGVVIVGSSPGGQSVTQPAPAPPAAVAAGANQAQPAAPPAPAAPVAAAPAA
ncbi:hypothetical protein CSAL01_02512 [Colletotrichum salicis]|uniref:Cas1p-like protein n=1 Tax=Colletotrichum salicis TaxID=1209931 RepID=A0A135UHT3_9PEZI|nr:hypothetical protein CSAL01_02512 [Colletotrichum salicis]